MYMLWDRDVLLYVGHAAGSVTILSRLMDHYCARAKPSQATHCSWELSENPQWMGRLGQVGVAAEVSASNYAETD